MKIKKYLHQSPLFALNVSYEAIIPKLNKQMKLNNLNFLQGLVLTALFFEERTDVTPSQLAEIFQTSRGNMSHILSELEYRGYVKRVVSTVDARQFKIELKAEGKKKAMALIKFYDQIQDLFEKELGVKGCKDTVEGIHTLSKIFEKQS